MSYFLHFNHIFYFFQQENAELFNFLIAFLLHFLIAFCHYRLVSSIQAVLASSAGFVIASSCEDIIEDQYVFLYRYLFRISAHLYHLYHGTVNQSTVVLNVIM